MISPPDGSKAAQQAQQVQGDIKPDVVMKYGMPCVDDDVQIVTKYGMPIKPPSTQEPEPQLPPNISMKYGMPCVDTSSKKADCGLKALVEKRGTEYVQQMLTHTKTMLSQQVKATEARQATDAITQRPIGQGFDPAAFSTKSTRAAPLASDAPPMDKAAMDKLRLVEQAFAKALEI